MTLKIRLNLDQSVNEAILLSTTTFYLNKKRKFQYVSQSTQ